MWAQLGWNYIERGKKKGKKKNPCVFVCYPNGT
jgi:hypothetical protein